MKSRPRLSTVGTVRVLGGLDAKLNSGCSDRSENFVFFYPLPTVFYFRVFGSTTSPTARLSRRWCFWNPFIQAFEWENIDVYNRIPPIQKYTLCFILFTQENIVPRRRDKLSKTYEVLLTCLQFWIFGWWAAVIL